MNLESNPLPLNYICEGCLSVDRKLTPIYDNEYRTIFIELLDSLGTINESLALCWECTAILHSFIQFKSQVHTAHHCLLNYMVNKTHFESLSKLKTSSNKVTHKFVYEEENDDKSSITRDTGKVQISEFDRNNEISEATKLCLDGTQPMTFIKIEDNDDFIFDDDFYDEHVSKDIELEGNKTELKLDYPDEQITNKKTKSKKARKKAEAEFSDSDDEPLKPSKKEKEVRPRGRPRKTEEDKKEVKRRSKKEKPAGVVMNSRVDKNLKQLNVTDRQIEMVVLSWEEVAAERRRALASAAFTRHEHRCGDCALGFNHRFKLDNHMAKHHPSFGPAECDVCRVRCRDDHALVAHKRRHRVRWRCVECGETWSRAAVAADHHARAHPAPAAAAAPAHPTHTCSRCGDTHRSLAKLRNHMKNHAERQKCELCGKTFRDRTSLRTHLFIHRGEKEYACPHCGKRFLFKKAMEVHLVTHSAPAQLYCLECDMTFKNRMSYYQHKKYNLKHIDPAKLKYACQLCDKKFLKAVRLQEHNFAVHLKVTPIRCTVEQCNFACSSRPVLRTHTRMVHRGRRAVRNHVCDTCGKAYTTKKTLEGHMRSHTGERPFLCKLCPSTFAYEAALYNHNKLVHLKGKTGRNKPSVPAGPSWQTPLELPTQDIR